MLAHRLRARLSALRAREDGVSTTIEVLVFVPLGLMFMGFLLNGAFHFVSLMYVSKVANDAATLTAAAGGDVTLPYVPNGGYNMKPSEYASSALDQFWMTPDPATVTCAMENATTEANSVARCNVRYTTIVFPTDPVTARAFGNEISVYGEDIAQTGTNPNVQ